MFDKTDIEKYQTIKAPPELKDRILCGLNEKAETERESNRGGKLLSRFPLRSVSALAACLLLAVAIFSFFRIGNDFAVVSYNGEVIGESRMAIEAEAALSAKSISEPAGIRFEIEAKRGEVALSVSHGNLYILEGEEVVCLGKTAKIEESKAVWWSDVAEEGTFEMTVSYGNEEETFVLEKDKNTPEGVIYKK